MKDEPKYLIPNLKNACRVLKLLGESTDEPMLAEICRELDLPQTSALRIMSTLKSENFIERHQKKYRLGSAIMQLCIHQEQSFDLRRIAVDELKELACATGETAHLAIPSGFRTLIIEVCESPHPIRAASRPGTVVESHCNAAGKIFVAHLFKNRLEELIRECPLTARTSRTITTRDQLEEEISIITQQGYAVDDEEFYDGVRCLAAPIFNRKGNVIAAVGITASVERFTRKRIVKVSKHVKKAAVAISEQVTV